MRRLIAAATSVVAILFCFAAAPVRASVAPVPRYADAFVFNAKICAAPGNTAWVHQAGVFTASTSQGTCISAERYHPDIQVLSTQNVPWSFPEITQGYGISVNSDPAHYPVQFGHDGTPLASGAAWLAAGTYNFAFDIWLSPTYGQHYFSQNQGDYEVMIWLADPGLNYGGTPVSIGGRTWYEGGWTASRGGRSWHYLRFIAPRTSRGLLTFSNLWINEFLRAAHVPYSYWLQAIDLGFELVRGGVTDNIHSYSLTRVA